MSLQRVDTQSLLLSGDSVGIFRKRPTNDVQEHRDILNELWRNMADVITEMI